MGSLAQNYITKQFSYKIAFAIFGIYFLTAKLGLQLATLNQHASPLWPAAGVALMSLIAYGRAYWPAVWLGAFAANLISGTPLAAVILIATGNALEAWVSKLFFRRFTNEQTLSIGLALIIALFSSVLFAVPISATCGSLGLVWTGVVPWSQFTDVWKTWWTGDAVGIFLIVPFLVSLFNREFSTHTFKKGLEYGVYCLVVGGASYLTFSAGPERTAFLIILFPILLYGIIRFSAVESGVSIFLMVGVGIGLTLQGKGPFYGSDPNTNLVSFQIFLAGIALTDLTLRFLKRSASLKSAAWVLCLCWALTGLIFHSINRRESEADQLRFNRIMTEANTKLTERIQLYESAIRAGMGLFKSVDHVTDEMWRRFVAELDLAQNFPGFYGLGYIVPVADSKLASFLETSKKNVQGFKYWPVDMPGGVPADNPTKEHFILMAMEPREPKARTPGADLSLEKGRYEVLTRARDTGELTISDSMTLKNPQGSTGFLIMSPVYRNGMPTDTVAERRKALHAWVMTPLITNLFFKGLFSSSVSEVAMEAFVSNRSDSNSILYSSIQQKSDLIEQHTNLSQLMLWGRTIQLKWYRTKSFESSKDSELAWLQLVCVVITLLLATLVGVFENILAQAHRIASQKTKELGERDRLWTSLSRVAPVGIFQLDRQGRIIFVNDKWVEFTGVAASRAPEFHWLDSVDSGDLLQIQNKWAELEKGEIDMLQVQCRLSASSKMFALSLLAVAGESGDFSHFIGTLQDISEIHARQMQVMQSSRLATLGVMAAGVAHEINNPLTIITGRAQLIGRQLDSPQIPAASLKDSVAIIKQTVDRIAKIVRGLRAFSRAGDEDVFMPSSVSHMVQSTLEFCSERYRKGSVELRVKALPEILLSCREVQVCQVLLNLLNNGYDAVLGCPQPWVELEVVETEREVKFIVTDSGSGIPPEVAERIMVPFFTTKPIGQGTGLGLSISKGIAQDHRGDLVLDASSKNTRFIFSVSKHLSDDDSRQATA